MASDNVGGEVVAAPLLSMSRQYLYQHGSGTAGESNLLNRNFISVGNTCVKKGHDKVWIVMYLLYFKHLNFISINGIPPALLVN